MKTQNAGNSVLGGLFWKFGERFLTEGVSFLIALVLARLLAPEAYGTLSLVTVFITLANVFVNSGFQVSLIQKKDADDTDYSTMLYCSLACSLLIYGVIYFCSPLIAAFYKNEELTLITRIFALRIPLSTLYAIQTAYVSRNLRFRQLFVSSIAAQVISGSLGIFLAYLGWGVWALVFQNMSHLLISTLVLLFVIPWRPKLLFSWTRAKSLLRYSSKILAADLSGTFFGELRTLIIGRVYTSADLAFFNKGQHLPQLISSNLNGSIMAVLFPALSNEADDLIRVKQMARRSLQTLSCIMCPIMFGIAVTMKPLILLMYTEKWADSIFFGQVFCICYAIGTLGIVPLQVLKAIGRSGAVLKLEVYKKPVYFALLLIGVFVDVKMIAITMLAYEIYGTFINMLQMRKYISYHFREILRDIAVPFLVSAVMVLVVSLIQLENSLILTLILQVLAGVVIYIAGSALLRGDGFVYLFALLKSKLERKKAA